MGHLIRMVTSSAISSILRLKREELNIFPNDYHSDVVNWVIIMIFILLKFLDSLYHCILSFYSCFYNEKIASQGYKSASAYGHGRLLFLYNGYPLPEYNNHVNWELLGGWVNGTWP